LHGFALADSGNLTPVADLLITAGIAKANEVPCRQLQEKLLWISLIKEISREIREPRTNPQIRVSRISSRPSRAISLGKAAIVPRVREIAAVNPLQLTRDR